MATETPNSGGVVLDTSLILSSVQYYAVIGLGLGLLGVVLLLQLGGGEGTSGSIVGALLSMVILAFAVLSGPMIAAFVGYATAGRGIGGLRTRVVNSGIANGIGFAVFGIVVLLILFAGISVVVGGGGGASGGSVTSGTASYDGGSGGGGSSLPIAIGDLVTLLVLMVLPNSVVGGAITFFIEGRGVPSGQ